MGHNVYGKLVLMGHHIYGKWVLVGHNGKWVLVGHNVYGKLVLMGHHIYMVNGFWWGIMSMVNWS